MRTLEGNNVAAMYVSRYGTQRDQFVSIQNGIRPALWLNLEGFATI